MYALPLEENIAMFYNPWLWAKILVPAGICDNTGSYRYRQKSVTGISLLQCTHKTLKLLAIIQRLNDISV
jgi:hypothetical protein